MQRPRTLTLLAFASLAFAGPARAQGDVWIVDDDGGVGVDFTTVQAAIDASPGGDLILIKTGDYGSVTLDGKGMCIQVDTDQDVTLEGFTVRNIPSNAVAFLRDATIYGGGGTCPSAAVVLENCAGPVWLEELVVNADGGTHGRDAFGLTVDNCISLNGQRLDITGGESCDQGLLGNGGTAGAVIDGSSVHFYDTDVSGGAGARPFVALSGGNGGSAVILEDGFLFASGGSMLGGDGLEGAVPGPPFFICTDGGDGGRGLVVGSDGLPSTDVQLLAVTPTGGAAGLAQDAGCEDGTAGADRDIVAGTVTDLPGIATSYFAVSPVREHINTFYTYVAQPNDFIYNALSLNQIPGLFLSSLRGSVLVANADIALTQGLLPASGTKTTLIPTTEMGPGIEFAMFWEQPFYIDLFALTIQAGATSTVTIVDTAF